METRVCAHCGKTYTGTKYARLKYCSLRCTGDAKRNGEWVRCPECGTPWYRRPCHAARTYCSKSCARSALNRTDANPAYRRDITGDKNPMYGKPGLRGADNPMYGQRKELAPRWKGGRKVRPDGYARVLVSADHPHPCEVSRTGDKYLLEHRHVMEQHLKRYLLPEEVVHHFDNDPTNNDIGNLILYANQAEHMREGHRRR